MNSTALVLTTINPPNPCMLQLAEGARKVSWSFTIAGDTKSPVDFAIPGVDFLSIERQLRAFPAFSKILPTRHYCRKNVAYLVAMRGGAEVIIETDDDNFPLDSFWDTVPQAIPVDRLSHPSRWVNVYSLFADSDIWPRGFPLERLADREPVNIKTGHSSDGWIVQGLANQNPDVDAVFRLTRSLPVDFLERTSAVAVEAGNWCPFNSQNTIFRKEAFPLLYLPAYCSFRMTDIWRSFVAQYCLWACGQEVVFRNATVYQDRNEHNLLKDFEDEVCGYLHNARMCAALETVEIDPQDLTGSLVRCYEVLVSNGWIGTEELPLVREWGSACDAIR